MEGLSWRGSHGGALMEGSHGGALMEGLSWRGSHGVALMEGLEWRLSCATLNTHRLMTTVSKAPLLVSSRITCPSYPAQNQTKIVSVCVCVYAACMYVCV